MKLQRRDFLRFAVAAVVLPAGPRFARAQNYPTRPVRVIVGFPAGGGDDIHARLMGQWLSERLGQSFLVENRPGASSLLAADAVAHAPPDGYTLSLLSMPTVISSQLFSNLNINLVRNIAPVASLCHVNFVMAVNPGVPATNVAEFILHAKANAGKISIATAGSGTPHHVMGEQFKQMTGVDLLHVPYRGEAPAWADLIGGQVHVMFGTVTGAIEHIKAGKLRALAVAGPTRLPVLPDLPPVSDFVPGFDVRGWIGVAAPPGTPSDIVDRLNRGINAGLASSSIQARYADLGVEPFPGTPADFGRLIAEESKKWDKVIRVAGIKPE
jgi:tripartite-type tricarboxylate transporter receptor subunit TctC